jgi:hypothetical protein
MLTDSICLCGAVILSETAWSKFRERTVLMLIRRAGNETCIEPALFGRTEMGFEGGTV